MGKRQFESSDGAWNPHGAPSHCTFTNCSRIKVHISTCLTRRLLAKVDERSAPIRHADHHESASSDVASVRVSHCQCESDGYGCINGVTPALQYLDADI